MESSIAEHLRTERTRPARKDETFTPPYPSFSARFRTDVGQVVMAYLGLQYPGAEQPVAATAALAELDARLAGEHGPGHHDRSVVTDVAGFATVLTVAYWDDIATWEAWSAGLGWTDPSRAGQGVGFFAEVLHPAMERFETLFSNDRIEGVSVLAERLSGEIREHGYWGGARDRVPLAQTDGLEPVGEPEVVDGPLVTVRGQQNLCLIRSGQEWTETAGEERRMYLEDVEPVLRAGMDFLRDDGQPIGCLDNRYVQVLDAEGRPTDKSYGLSWWRSMQDLDTWAESHPTHLAIFGVAMRYLSTMGPAAKLRLYHEVTVAAADEQSFAYLDCHPRTGLLRTTGG